MKRKSTGYVLFIIGLFFCGLTSAQSWSKLDSEGDASVVAIDSFIFSRDKDGNIIKRSDDGDFWTVVLTTTGGNLKKGNDNHLYYYNDNILLESADKGNSWDTIPLAFIRDIESEDFFFEDVIQQIETVNGFIVVKESTSTNYDAPAYAEYYHIVDHNGNLVRDFTFVSDPNCHNNNLVLPQIYSNGTHLFNVFINNDVCPTFNVVDLVISADNGNSWNHYPLDSILPDGYTFDKFLDDGAHIYLQAKSGSSIKVFFVNTNGALDELELTGLPSLVINAITSVESNLLASVNFQIYISKNQGDSWSLYSMSGFPSGATVNSIAKAGENLFAGTDQGIWKTKYSSVSIAAVKDKELNTVNIYPNPSSGSFHIAGLEEVSVVEVYYMNGEKIYEIIAEEKDVILNPGLQEGMYILKIKNEGGSSVSRLVIR
ncbi:MAG: T9SS type A sorting domain-containing protein [Cytophagaceae bacterium]|nr:T9SS type A sorting domain-containing protein [Cytophagaceae bacterium]